MINTTAFEMTLRVAAADDVRCVAALGLQVFLDTYATQGIRDAIAREAMEAFSCEAISALIACPSTLLTLAESDGHLIGFAQVALRAKHEMIDSKHAAELQRLYIQERFTGRGVGPRLLGAVERRAARGGASLLWATVWAGNERALGFYPRQDYQFIGSPMFVFQSEAHENRLFAKMLNGDGPDNTRQES